MDAEALELLYPTKELEESGRRLGAYISHLIVHGFISEQEMNSAAAEIQKELDHIFLLGSRFGYKQCCVDAGFLTVEEAKAMGKGGKN